MNSKIEKIYNKINNTNKQIIFFGLSYCGYCKKTIELLNRKKIIYKYYVIDNIFNEFFDIFKQISILHPELNINPSHNTVPVIFINRKFIGGYNDLEKILNY